MSSINSPNLYLIGTAEYGISNTPILIDSEEQLISIYGLKGTLIDSYRKISSITNVPNIYVFKCNGRHSNVFANIIHQNNVVFKGVEFKAIYSSSEYNNITILFTDAFLQIVSNNKVLEYNFDKYNTIQKLFKAINDDADNCISPISVINYTLEQISHPANSLVSCNKPILVTDGGEDGLECNKKEIFTSISKSLNSLYGTSIDCIIFSDCYIDDYEIDNGEDILNYYKLMLDFCNKQLKYNVITKGVIGFKPLQELTNSTELLKEHLINYYYKVIDKSNSKYERKNLSLITVTFGDIYYDNNRMIDNHYLAYSSVICSEDYKNNITNVDYGDKIKINYMLPFDVINILKELNFVFLRESPLTNKVHIVNANNMSNEIFACEYVIRSLQRCYKTFNTVFDDILGEAVNNNTEQKINLLVTNTLKQLQKTTAIEKSSFFVRTVDDNTIIEILLYFPNYINPIKYFVTK